MQNIIYTDADLTAFLVANEEQTGNTIEVVIECDATASQELTITAGDASTTEQLTPSTKNVVDIPAMLWNFGSDTVITLSKGGTDAGTITIHFPGAIDSDAALNDTAAQEFTMQGSASVQEQIVSLQESVERVSAQTLAYILPSAVDQSGIADGGSNTVETFEIEAGAEAVKVAFYTCIQFLATTTVTAVNAYEDLVLTVTLTLDGNPIATILQAYRDGRQVLTLNHLVENLSKGNHTLTLSMAAAGGSVSVMQIIAAYLLTAKSTGSGSVSEQPLFVNGNWAPGVLVDGLDANKMTESAYLNGVENSIVISEIETSPGAGDQSFENLAPYYLSDYVLREGQYYSEFFYKTNAGTFTVSGATGQAGPGEVNRGCYFCIPIKRLSGFNTLRYSAKIMSDPGTEFVFANVCVAAVINGVFTLAEGPHYKPEDWQTYEHSIAALPYVDYIILRHADGVPAYKNIVLLKQ